MTSTFGCPHCGKGNPIDALFCAFCGTRLQDVETSLREQQDQQGGEAADEDLPEDAPILPPRPARRLRGHATRPSPPQERKIDDPPDPEPGSSGLHRPPLRADTSFSKPPSSTEDPVRSAAPTPTDRADLSIPSSSEVPNDVDPAELAAWLERFPQPNPLSTPMLSDETRRQLRQLFVSEVPLAEILPHEARSDGGGLQRRTWIYWLLLAVLGFALLFGDEAPETLPHVWPGVGGAYAAINTLPTGSTVLIDWAYDPATAGEMDQVARPVIEHLIAQNADLIVISQLPLGPASARRLIAAAETSVWGEITAQRLDATLVEGGFLPGGAATLPLLGQAPALGLPVDLQGRSAEIRPPLQTLTEDGPALALVISAQFEPVQRWLEQVQPLNQTPTLAITSAAAAPPLRPYLDSGQLAGLVSGYNGGIGYRQLLLRPLARAEQIPLWRQIRGHNSALIVLLIVLVIGNLALSLERRSL
ncbi:MAG: hypothetical protein KF893_09305 [Caldilineaceae bacterium]|nr:hypothetical protein [Caldilineaceae bacterium]